MADKINTTPDEMRQIDGSDAVIDTLNARLN